MGKRVNWGTIAEDYMSSRVSLRDLSEKYGVALSKIGAKASEEGWKAKRLAFQKNRAEQYHKHTQAVREEPRAEAKGESPAVPWQSMVTKATRTAIEGLLSQAEQVKDYPPSMAQAWLAALDKAMKIAREMDGYISPADMAKIEVAKAELEIKKEEHARLMAEASSSKEPVTVTMDDSMERYNK